jgi:hypothetical protein
MRSAEKIASHSLTLIVFVDSRTGTTVADKSEFRAARDCTAPERVEITPDGAIRGTDVPDSCELVIGIDARSGEFGKSEVQNESVIVQEIALASAILVSCR